MRILILILISITLSSCSLVRKKSPRPAAPDAHQELAKIEIDLAAGAKKKAKRRLKTLISSQAGTDVADDASIMLGKIYYRAKDYNAAFDSFISVVNSEFFSPREADAALFASRALNKLGRYDEALSLTGRGLKYRGLSPSLKLKLYKVRYSVLEKVGDRLDALRAIIYIKENSENKRDIEKHRILGMDFVESRLNDAELEVVARDRRFSFVRATALFRVATHFFEQRDYSRARDYFETVIKLSPNTDLAFEAESQVQQIEARRRVNPFTVGAILPLSGRHSKVAYRSLRGLQLGLGISSVNGSRFSLAVIDSEGNPDKARRAVERLVVEDHVVGVVGSLLSRTSVAVASKSDDLGVPNIALSQKSGLTEIGENVFQNALTSSAQVRHLVRMAMEVQGLRKFAILFPNDPYGIEYTNLFWDEVLARGGEIVAAQSYKSRATNFNDSIARLVGTYYLEDRKHEYRVRFQDWLKKQKVISKRKTPPDDLLPPIIDFDAIFIPDSSNAVGQIAPTLAFNDIKDTKLLGTNLWNSGSFVKRGQGLVGNSLFVDGVLTTDSSFKKSRFSRDFYATFGYYPGIFEAQAYDAGLIIRQIIAGGERSRVGLKTELTQINAFKGALGELQMTQRRELARPLVGLTVNDGKISRASMVPHVPEITEEN